MSGAKPLSGIKVVEFAGLAPGPMAGMVLADFGADVIRVDRPNNSAVRMSNNDVLARGKRSLAVDTKTRSGLEVMRKLIARADVLIDPFRPGVLERLGLGPDVILGQKGLNPRLIYARLAGFPRTGPHKDMAGHDINYIALSGVLSLLPGEKKPVAPINILGDFAGGAMMCVLGILAALHERDRSGLGQVVNTDMVSGSRYLSSFVLLHAQTASDGLPMVGETRATGLLDGGAPYYNIYTCSDGRWMSVGCLEPQFFAQFLERFLAALPTDFALEGGWRPSRESQFNPEQWPRLKEFMETGFKSRPRDYWANVFHGSDACTVPVLSVAEANALASRQSNAGSSATVAAPMPHPDLSRTPASAPTAPAEAYEALLQPGAHNEEILRELGLTDVDVSRLRREGALGATVAKL